VLYAGPTPGGQLTETSVVENFPGYPEGVAGPRMMEDLRRQAERFGAAVRSGEVTEVALGSRPFRASIDGGAHEIEADSMIVATGATARYLGLPSERRFAGMGVSACAVCDGFFYRGRDVAVVGGGDSACEEALHLSTICRHVWLVVRKPFLRASAHMRRRVEQTPNIEILYGHTTDEILGGEGGVTGVRLRSSDGAGRTLAIEGFFLGIGHTPRTAVFGDQLLLDAAGYIVTRGGVAGGDCSGGDALFGPGATATSVAGVFAAGDVADPIYQQAVTAAGSGCRAALDCERFLNDD
jgi:thioredoxin reductase (NADPH)